MIEESNDALERALLREARDYRASPRARRLALAAMVGAPRPSWARAHAMKLLVGGAALAGALVWFAAGRAPRPITPSAPVQTVAPAVDLQRPEVPQAPIETPRPIVAPAPEKSAKPALVASPSLPNRPKSSLAEEIALIDRARKAVYASDKAGAQRALDEYDQRFPSGALVPEAKTLRAKSAELP